MEDNKKKPNTDNKDCETPSTKSISDIVHEHLKNKNDHITDDDIRNAEINPDENELERENGNPQQNAEKNEVDEKEEEKTVTPWDVVDKNALE